MTALGVLGVHTVTIGENGRVNFACAAGPDADCRNYPACECESWDADHEHPSVPQDECWMTAWFENDGIAPSSDALDEAGYVPGMSGPILTYFCDDYIEWEFAK